MNLELEDKTVLVSGSSRGIGRAIAEAFLHEGARVIVTGRDAASLQSAVAAMTAASSPERVMSITGDLTDPGSIRRALSQIEQAWGKLEILVANIGSGVARGGWELSPEEWLGVFQQNLFGSMNLVQAALPQLIASGPGSVIFIASIAGLEAMNAPMTYAAAKAALVAASKSLSRLLGGQGIRVNAVAPGNILFPGGSWERKLQAQREFVQHYIQSEVPLQRFGTPEEVANMVVFLASERASFVTGACIVVDGGQTHAFR